jgi:hypothetical protein
MKIKTAELTGRALSWAVAVCEDFFADIALRSSGDYTWSPGTKWMQGGPIIERERITVDASAILGQWMAVFYVPNEEPWEMRGPTPLIAAMRCYVASKLGDEVEVPYALFAS